MGPRVNVALPAHVSIGQHRSAGAGISMVYTMLVSVALSAHARAHTQTQHPVALLSFSQATCEFCSVQLARHIVRVNVGEVQKIKN